MVIQMKVFCPSCKEEVEIKIQSAKEKMKCPKCKRELTPKAKLLGE